MSFANIDLEAQKSQKLKKTGLVDDSTPQSELDKIITNTSKQLQVFGGLVSQLDLQKKHIGSRRDSTQLRQNVDELVLRITDLEKAIELLISNVSRLINKKSNDPKQNGIEEGIQKPKLQVSNRQILIKERLVNEFNELHKQFQRSIRIYNEKKKAYTVRDEVKREIDERTPLIQDELSQSQVQTQLQVQEQEEAVSETELQYHLLLTEERNREINQVAEGILEVNSIFKDLGELVNQQGEQLDNIEDNILQLHGNTQQAQKELTKAHEYQKAKGKWSCILLVALTILVLIIVLAVVS